MQSGLEDNTTWDTALQVHTVLSDGDLPVPGFSNTWIKQADIALQPLAIAVDDVTVAFVEQMQRLLGTSTRAGASDSGARPFPRQCTAA